MGAFFIPFLGVTRGPANATIARTTTTITPTTHFNTLTKSTHSAFLQARHNSAMHAKKGNRQGGGQRGKNMGYKLVHWNKGSAFFQNKIIDISHIIDNYKPHIFSISEANLDIEFDTSTLNLSNYKFETTSMAQITGRSRQILLI